MSSDALPISSPRFAEALRSLPLDVLHLKISELRLSIVRLDYSNEQMKPFADGTDENVTEPDRDCIEAMEENKQVIERQVERIDLVKRELERRGLSLREVEEGGVRQEEAKQDGVGTEDGMVNGTRGATGDGDADGRSSAWTDGTIQTGRITNGNVHLDESNVDPEARRMDNAVLRAALEVRMRELESQQDGEDEDGGGGMHL